MLSRVFLIKQGRCCGNRCLMCSYTKKHSGNSKIIRSDVLKTLEGWEKKELKDIIDSL